MGRNKLPVTIQTSAAYWTARFDGLGWQAMIIDYFVSSLIALGVTVGAMHIMEAAMSSRAEEIAVLRAIGFAGTPIALAFIFEAIVLACLGAALGTVIDWLWLDGWLVDGAYDFFFASWSRPPAFHRDCLGTRNLTPRRSLAGGSRGDVSS